MSNPQEPLSPIGDRLGRLAIEIGYLSPIGLESCLLLQRARAREGKSDPLGQLLLELDVLEEGELGRLLAAQAAWRTLVDAGPAAPEREPQIREALARRGLFEAEFLEASKGSIDAQQGPAWLLALMRARGNIDVGTLDRQVI